ncbi:NUDIX hydrolase [Planctomonas sp. JC2975]|uniref:NUDIX domain-containing protein n=1 Tax=Planctomonas sp. JC2975 TaxID=2729626 RepID=UPI001472887C|nr:NUDIX hydrolase [Planctomonas sp. JC2975]NNC10281.1 NUDIX hydrolase [Planctomonas sp. JC2975]
MPELGASDDRRTLDELADEPYAATVVDSEVVYRGRVWDVRRDTVDIGHSTIVREYVDHTGAVAVLAMDDEERVLLIKQYRHPIRTRDWELPAGLLDLQGESPLKAAQRELAEEADAVADTWNVLTEFASTPGGNNEVIRIYLARGVRHAGETFAREEEEADIEVRWVPLDEVVRGVLERRLRNAPLSLGVLAAVASRSTGYESLGPADAPFQRGSWLTRPLDGRASR